MDDLTCYCKEYNSKSIFFSVLKFARVYGHLAPGGYPVELQIGLWWMEPARVGVCVWTQRCVRAASRTRVLRRPTRRSSATRPTAATSRASRPRRRSSTTPTRTSRPPDPCRPTPPTGATSTASRSTRCPPGGPRTDDDPPDSSRSVLQRASAAVWQYRPRDNAR